MLDTPTTAAVLAKVGDRIECSGYFGTIKYVGPVEGYPGIWFGIDWDNSERGKHDGTVHGKRYFLASNPKSGSFVRPEKLHLGQSAVTAITSRYGQQDDEITAKIHEQQLLSIQQSINAPFLKLVGFEAITSKQSDFHNLQVVNLRLQKVCSVGEPNELRQLCPNITELDVSKNLLNSWPAVFDVCAQLKHLAWLNVSENFMSLPDDVAQFSFSTLETLICGSMRLTWPDVLKLSSVFPGLVELRAPNNKITKLDTPATNFFTRLGILDLENNPIGEWSEISKLRVAPSLEHVSLENVALKSVRFETSVVDDFPNLSKLVLSNNLITDWESIGELNKLRKLEDLRFLKNPILETESFNTAVQLIIAKIANLKYLNGSLIQSDERRGAEYDYVKKYGLEYLAVRNTQEEAEFFAKHNRYAELIESKWNLLPQIEFPECGVPEESELTVQSKVIQASLIDIELYHESKTVKKKLPPSILIQKLIVLVQRLFSLSARPNLVYVSGIQPDIEILLDDECKELGYYSVQDGDKIIVKE